MERCQRSLACTDRATNWPTCIILFIARSLRGNLACARDLSRRFLGFGGIAVRFREAAVLQVLG